MGAGGADIDETGLSLETATAPAGGIEAEPAATPAAPPIWFAGGLLLAATPLGLAGLAVAVAGAVAGDGAGLSWVLVPADPPLLADAPAGGLPVPEAPVAEPPVPLLVAPAPGPLPAVAAVPFPAPLAGAPSPAPATSTPFPGAAGSDAGLVDHGRHTARTVTNRTTIEPATNKLGRFVGASRLSVDHGASATDLPCGFGSAAGVAELAVGCVGSLSVVCGVGAFATALAGAFPAAFPGALLGAVAAAAAGLLALAVPSAVEFASTPEGPAVEPRSTIFGSELVTRIRFAFHLGSAPAGGDPG